MCADIFTMYVIYKPTGSNSIWIPVKALDWSWNSSASCLNGIWIDTTLKPSNCGTSYYPAELPTWTQNEKSLQWVKIQ
jgi:hypothetical protein